MSDVHAKYECPACGLISSGTEWNIATMKVFGKVNLGKIEEEKDDCIFICPKCAEEVDGEEIERR